MTFMLKQGGDKKRVRHQLDGADLALFIPAGDAQIALLQLRGKRAVHPVAAVVALFNALPTIGAGNQRISPQLDDGSSLHQRAVEGSDHHPPFAVGFRMTGVLPAEHVTGVFNHRMLKAAAGTEERNAVFTGIADSDKRTFRVTIRAAGNDPDGIVLRQRVAGGDRRGGEPVIFHRLLQHGGSIVYRQGNGLMGNNIGVIIADEGEA